MSGARWFESEGDYLAFLRVMSQTSEQAPMRILAWCLMPNHWHLLGMGPRDSETSRRQAEIFLGRKE
jgi:putative transposase